MLPRKNFENLHAVVAIFSGVATGGEGGLEVTTYVPFKRGRAVSRESPRSTFVLPRTA